MAEGADSYSHDARLRPQTPQDFSLLKTIRYEDATNGLPPLPVGSVDAHKAPSSSHSRDHATANRATSSSSATTSSRALQVPAEVKRDSGVATSASIPASPSHAESNTSTSLGDVAKEASLPIASVQDENTLGGSEKSRSPFTRPRSSDKQVISESPEGAQRIDSLEGMSSGIPTGDFNDIDLQDLTTDKVAFSKRGSILFGGKKMNQVLRSPNTGNVQAAVVGSSSVSEDADTFKESTTETDQVEKRGLVAGPRKPSAHMLQAALEGGRVLSADEMALSMRVRSMYDYGDERAADWATAGLNGSIARELAESRATDRSTPEPSGDAIVVEKTRQAESDNRPTSESQTSNVRGSYYKQPTEHPSGIEDYEDIDGQNVDRYGFINPARVGSRPSTGEPPSSEGIQHVATSLRIESDQPRKNRKLRRGPSIGGRSSRSLPPQTRRDENVKVASLHSVQNHRPTIKLPTGNPFRSKERRTLAEASDMLTLPPGLADIAEQDEDDVNTSAVKRKERSREQKWQNMASLEAPRERERSTGKGGGMRFEFDTRDQKLVSRTWKGIPDRWRATAWHHFLSASAKKRGIGAPDDELVLLFHKLQEEGSVDDVQIDVDVPRTINMHVMFRRRYRGGQRLLFRVLHAISLYFPETGYVQGMASLVATLLCYFEEERAFVMMVRLWQLRGLEQLFASGFGGLMKALDDFEKHWLRNGDVAKKLEELGISSTAYGTRWYLTLFNMSVPFPAQLRIWDVFMLLGDATDQTDNGFGGADLDVLHATSAALMDASREIVLDSDFENAMKVLTSFVPIKDEDLLMRVAKAEWKLHKKRAAKN